MAWLILVVILASLALATLSGRTVDIELRCVNADGTTRANCRYNAGQDISLDVYASATAPDTRVRVYKILIESGDTATNDFTFTTGAVQASSFFTGDFITNRPNSATQVGNNFFGWIMFDVQNAGETLNAGKRKLGSIKGRAVSTQSVLLLVSDDANHDNDQGTYFQEILGRFPKFHAFTSTPLTINPPASCGDAQVDTDVVPPEECDNGAANSNTLPNACREDCQNAHCGDTIIDSGEVCDGATGVACTTTIGYVGTQDCASDCLGFNACVATESCGDGTINGPEVCELSATQSCTTNDGYAGTESCTADCAGFANCVTAESCGDGTINGPEQCDNGASNSDTDVDACRTNCNSAGCGDNVVDTGEECDDGNTVAGDDCSPTCIIEIPADVDGDGIVDKNEPAECVEEPGTYLPDASIFPAGHEFEGCRKGDMNDDGVVKALDLNLWFTVYETTGPSKGNLNEDNVVNAVDLNSWLSQYENDNPT